MPVSKLNPVLSKVAFPVFAKRQTDAEALRRGFGELVELVAVVTFPLLVGLGVTASIAVPVLFGPEWQPAVVLVQIMVAMGMLKCLSNPLGSVLLAKGRADVGFWLNVVATAVTIPVLWAVVERGTEAVAWAHTALNLAFFFVELLLIRHIVGMGVGRYLRRLAKPSAATAVMGVVVALAMLLPMGSLPNAAELVLLVAIGVAVYVLTWLVMARDYVVGLVRLFVRRAPEGS